MNERIRQLAEQAGYTKDMFGVGHWDMPQCEKFAKLIIADIIKIVEPDQYHQAYPDNVIGSYGGLELLENKVSKIKKHFDVR